MESIKKTKPANNTFNLNITSAEDRLRLDHWMPPQPALAPRIRLGRLWVNILWALPIAVVLLILSVAVAQELRMLPSVQAFITRYPGDATTRQVTTGFPLWLRLQHFFNAFFMIFIIRAGLQILADHPRLYINRDSTPGTEWFRFQKEAPRTPTWTSKDDSVSIPSWLGIPGIRHTVGLARWWHFSFDLLWVINGLVFYVLIFATGQWLRIVPTSWAVFPNALSTFLQYLSLQFPMEHTWTVYNGLQQLTYFVTVFIAAPIAFVTGVMQGPAFSNKSDGFGKLLNRQLARTIHFIVLNWFLLFIFIHTTLAFITGVRKNFNYIFAGVNNSSWAGLFLYLPILLIFVAAWLLASPLTVRHARRVQRAGETLVGYVQSLAELWDPKTQYSEKDISPYLWTNGTLPTSDFYNSLRQGNFLAYRLKVGGLIENPREFSYAELKALPKQEQITKHFCIQGWSGVAKWGGVTTRLLMELVKPLPEARYVVFYSFADGADGGIYYDVHTIRNMYHELSLLAYEMNGAPLDFYHGAPLRLRAENQLGFKMVKWIQAIEFVSDYSHIGAGQGGYNEDHEFYGFHMPI